MFKEEQQSSICSFSKITSSVMDKEMEGKRKKDLEAFSEGFLSSVRQILFNVIDFYRARRDGFWMLVI